MLRTNFGVPRITTSVELFSVNEANGRLELTGNRPTAVGTPFDTVTASVAPARALLAGSVILSRNPPVGGNAIRSPDSASEITRSRVRPMLATCALELLGTAGAIEPPPEHPALSAMSASDSGVKRTGNIA